MNNLVLRSIISGQIGLLVQVGIMPTFFFNENRIMVSVEARIKDIIRQQIEEDGYELLHVEMHSEGGSPILRIYVDSPAGITVDDCANISRKVAVLLDVEDPVEGKYTLEVSSPGIERPLFSEKDYLRFKGREIRLSTRNKIDNQRKFRGHIDSFENGVLKLASEGRLVSIDFDEIKKANLVYDFGEKK